MDNHSEEDERTLWVGNIDNKVTEELLYELFLQGGPLESVKIPKDHKTGKQRNFGFVKFQHAISVPYVIDLMNGIPLFDTPLRLDFKSKPPSLQGNSENGYDNMAKRRRMNGPEYPPYPNRHMEPYPHDHPSHRNYPPGHYMPPPSMHRVPMNWDRHMFHEGGPPRQGYFEDIEGGERKMLHERRKMNMGMKRSYSIPHHMPEERRSPRRRNTPEYSSHRRR